MVPSLSSVLGTWSLEEIATVHATVAVPTPGLILQSSGCLWQVPGPRAPSLAQPGCGLLNFPLCLPRFKGLQASLHLLLTVPICLLPKN